MYIKVSPILTEKKFQKILIFSDLSIYLLLKWAKRNIFAIQ